MKRDIYYFSLVQIHHPMIIGCGLVQTRFCPKAHALLFQIERGFCYMHRFVIEIFCLPGLAGLSDPFGESYKTTIT